MEMINGNDLFQMFNYGNTFISNKRKHLNDINVFPVPDGDTGNNLTYTLNTILRESKNYKSFIDSLDSISEAALIGARGNSGVIFAQFVNGLRFASNDYEEITIKEFARLVRAAHTHTVSSLSNPVEGTMITILDCWADSLESESEKKQPLKEVFKLAYEYARESLERTKAMLDVLVKNDVVDSGALGFVLFFKGVSSYFNNEKVELVDTETVEIEDAHEFVTEIKFRYCTEGLLKYNDLDEEKLKSDLNVFGDSIIIAKGKTRLRVHIHTNNPEHVFSTLEEHGQIESQKIDDMLLEMNIKNAKDKRVVVTDSIADLSPEIILDNNVIVIPINIMLNGTSYLDKLSISNKLLFNNLGKFTEYPKTATPSIKFINDLFSKLFLKFDEIFVITVSKKLSGTYEVIKREADKLNAKNKNIYVIDSKNNSVTEGLIVMKAIELIKSDKTKEEIVETLESLTNKTNILVCLDTFKYATMSGRVPKAVGKFGMFIGLRPIMSLADGKGTAFGFAFRQKGITKKIVKLIKRDMEKNGINSYALVHCLNEKLVKEYNLLFTTIIGQEPKYITEISTATAIHSGVGSVAIGYIKDNE
jgi:DegV family protein with EDD domain